MVEASRQFWIAAALVPAFGLCVSCASQPPDGELACSGNTPVVTCPGHAPLCEQRPAESPSRARPPPTPRFGEVDRAPSKRARISASLSFRLIEQSVAQADGSLLAAGR